MSQKDKTDDKEKDEDSDGIKVILVGEPGTGKTCLINASIGLKFEDNPTSTISSTFVPKKIKKDDGNEYMLNIWDTVGQEKYRSMTKIFIKQSKIVLLVYAINNKSSFEGLKSYWVNTMKDVLGDTAVYAIIGNKNDLYLEEQVKESEAKEYADQLGLKLKLVSAKADPQGFNEVLEELLDDYIKKNGYVPPKQNGLDLKNNKIKKKKSKFC